MTNCPQVFFAVVVLLISTQIGETEAFHVRIQDGKVQLKFGGSLFIPEFALDVGLPKVLKYLGFDCLLDALGSRVVEAFNDVIVGKEPDESNDGSMSCIRTFGKMAVHGIPAVNSCLDDIDFCVLDFWNIPKKLMNIMPCMFKCVLKKTNILNDEGMLNFPYLMELFSNMSDPFRNVVMKIGEQCGDEVSALQPNDTSCEPFGSLFRCVTVSTLKMSGEILDSCSEIPQAFKTGVKKVANTTSSLFG